MSWTKKIGVIGSAPQHHLGGKKATEKLISMAKLQNFQKILVVGCGNGKTALSIAKKFNSEVIGTDINPKSVLEANKNLKRLGKKMKGNVVFKTDDILNSSFPKNNFDRIIVESVLIMLPKEKALGELRSLLAPDGLLVINEALRLSANESALKKLETEFNRADISWYLPSYNEWTQYFIKQSYHIEVKSGAIACNMKYMGLTTFIGNPIESITWFLKLLLYKEALTFFLRISALTNSANINWAYCIWICKRTNTN